MSSYEQAELTTVLGALLGTQNGREVAIQNSFELNYYIDDADNVKINEEFFVTRREQCECGLLL